MLNSLNTRLDWRIPPNAIAMLLKNSINVIVTLSLDIAEHKTFPEVWTFSIEQLYTWTHETIYYNTTAIVIKVVLFIDINIFNKNKYYKNKHLLDISIQLLTYYNGQNVITTITVAKGVSF